MRKNHSKRRAEAKVRDADRRAFQKEIAAKLRAQMVRDLELDRGERAE